MPATRTSSRLSARAASASTSAKPTASAKASKPRPASAAPASDPNFLAIQRASGIELVVPGDLPKAAHWAPGRFEPSVHLTRVEFTSPTKLPTDTTAKDVKGPFPLVRITKHIKSYRFSDLYYAELDNLKLAVRLLDVARFSRTEGPLREYVEGYIATQAHVHQLAADIAGVVKLGGVFAKDSLYCLVYEDIGRPLIRKEKMASNNRTMKDEVMVTVRQLADVGVAPSLQNTNWRDVWRAPDGRAKLTLEEAEFLETFTPALREKFGQMNPGLKGLDADQFLVNACEGALEQAAEMFDRPELPSDSE